MAKESQRSIKDKMKVAVCALLASGAAMTFSAATTPTYAADFSSYSGTDKTVIDHSAWGGFLSDYLVLQEGGVNLVNYSGVSEADKSALKSYIDELEEIDPTRLTEDEAFAYWVNLYNAVTIDVVLDNYPVSSIKDIKSGWRAGPWKTDLVAVNGEDLTLDNIEHDILRKFFDEPRVHYAVNCASIGCPNLAIEPYTGATLDAQLDKAAYAYVNDPRGVTVKANGRVVLSKIYTWFKDDFGSSQAQVLAHIRRYAKDDLRAKLTEVKKIDGYAYDWNLNDTK